MIGKKWYGWVIPKPIEEYEITEGVGIQIFECARKADKNKRKYFAKITGGFMGWGECYGDSIKDARNYGFEVAKELLERDKININHEIELLNSEMNLINSGLEFITKKLTELNAPQSNEGEEN